MIACNASAGSKNAAVSNARPTAFTPAGYAFAIWGVIYSLGVANLCLQLQPSRWAWVRVIGGPWWSLNFCANALWIFAFTGAWGGTLWPAQAIITAGILLPLLILHRTHRVGDRDPARSPSFAEFWACHAFISIYAGWTCVATIANASLALTPENGPALAELGGWSASNWSIALQCTAAAVALLMLGLHRDALFVAPIAWALFAIAAQQEVGAPWPGDSRVVLSARILGSALAALAVLVMAARAAAWMAGRTRFAPAVVRLPFCASPLRVAAFGWVEAVDGKEGGSGDGGAATGASPLVDGSSHATLNPVAAAGVRY